MNKSQQNKIKWYMLSFMCFSTLWGFGNVLNGFVYFNGTQVIFSWILMFALYFVPYALMVGELGSAFKNSGGGVSSWIHETTGAKAAYYAGWTYWACHVTYIASKGSGGLKALSWMIFQNAEKYASFNTKAVQLVTFAVLLFFCWVASRGLNPLKKLATLAGTSMFVMSILYILLMFAAPVINPNGGYLSVDFSLKNLIPHFDWKYFSSLSILVFAVAGSFLVSCDNAHAVHPNHGEKTDAVNCSWMNKGIVIKESANQKYTTDAFSRAVFTNVCNEAGVPVQVFANRSDILGGSTLGNLSNTQVSVHAVDIGLPQLAMHSCYETAGVKDVEYAIRALTKFYQTALQIEGAERVCFE